MANEVVVRFLEATSQDECLRAGLAGILGVEDGASPQPSLLVWKKWPAGFTGGLGTS